MSQKFSLKWNDFNTHVRKAFIEFRDENSFCDVTLVSDDNHEFQAHKVVLSTCSDYFKNLLRRRKNNDSTICLERLTCQELKSVINYIYKGEIEIEKHHLKRFVEIAKRFRLAGLQKLEDNFTSDVIVSSKAETKEDEDMDIFVGDHFSNTMKDDSVSAATSSNFQPKVEVSNVEKSQMIHHSNVGKEIETPHESILEDIVATENSAPNIDNDLNREYSNRTLFNDDLIQELLHINFTRSVTPSSNIYDCNICNIRYFTFFEAKEHFEASHQNVLKEKELIIEMMTFMRNMKKQLRTETPDKTKENYPALSSDFKNRIATLKNIHDWRLNENLRIKKAKLLSWMESRVFNFYNTLNDN